MMAERWDNDVPRPILAATSAADAADSKTDAAPAKAYLHHGQTIVASD